MHGFGAPGVIELVLLAAIVLGPALLVIFVVRASKSRGLPPRRGATCPGCDAAVDPSDYYCRECGCPLSGPPAK